MKKTIYYIDNREQLSDDDIILIEPKELFTTDIKDNDEFIVSCELNIDKEGNSVNKTNFYGVKLIQEFRRKGFKNKILFVSYATRAQIVKDSVNTIINTIGHSFLQLPLTKETLKNELEQTEPLSQDDLFVCQQLYCRKKGLISELTHSLDSDIVGADKKEKALKIIKEICSIADIDFEQEKKKFNQIEDDKSKKIKAFVESLGTKASNKVTDTNDEDDTITLEPIADYEVLWLDDEVDMDNPIYEKLDEFEEIKKIHTVKTVDEAISILKEDHSAKNPRPKIMVAIVDYRLLDDEGKHQSKQGYHLIKEIARLNFLVQVIAYSSMPRNIQLRLAESYGISVTSIPKKALDIDTENGLKYIVEEIIRLGNENWERINNMPKGYASNWNLIEGTYKQLVSQKENKHIEDQISKKALKWIEQYENNEAGWENTISIGTNPFKPIYKSDKIAVKHSDYFFKEFEEFRKINQKNYKSYFDEIIDSYERDTSKFNEIPIKTYGEKKLLKLLYKERKNFFIFFKQEWGKKKLPGFIKKNNTDSAQRKSNNIALYYDEVAKPLLKELRDLASEHKDTRKAELLSEKNIKSGINLFAARRVILYLCFVKGYFDNGTYKPEMQLVIRNSGYINFWAALSPSDFPLGVTIEEFNWVKNNFDEKLHTRGIELKKEKDALLELYKNIAFLFTNYFNAFKKTKRGKTNYISKIIFSDELQKTENNTKRSSVEYHFSFIGNELNYNSFQKITDIFKLIEWIKNEQLETNESKEFKLFIGLWRKLLKTLDNFVYQYKIIESSKSNISKKEKLERNFLTIAAVKTVRNNILNLKPKNVDFEKKSLNQIKEIVIKALEIEKDELGFLSLKNNIESEYIYMHAPVELYFNRQKRIHTEPIKLENDLKDKENGFNIIFTRDINDRNKEKKITELLSKKSFYYYEAIAFINKTKEKKIEPIKGLYPIEPEDQKKMSEEEKVAKIYDVNVFEELLSCISKNEEKTRNELIISAIEITKKKHNIYKKYLHSSRSLSDLKNIKTDETDEAFLDRKNRDVSMEEDCNTSLHINIPDKYLKKLIDIFKNILKDTEKVREKIRDLQLIGYYRSYLKGQGMLDNLVKEGSKDYSYYIFIECGSFYNEESNDKDDLNIKNEEALEKIIRDKDVSKNDDFYILAFK